MSLPDPIQRGLRTAIQVGAPFLLMLAVVVPLFGQVFGLDGGQLAAIGGVITALAGALATLQNKLEELGLIKPILKALPAPPAP